MAKLKICVNDKLEKVVAHASNEEGGSLFFNGKAVDDLDETVEHAGIHEGAQLILIGGGGCFGEPVRWKRFRFFEEDDSMSSSLTYWDAICYKPKQDIYFCGFGVSGSYYRKNMTFILSWVIDDKASEEHKVEFPTDECVDKVHDFKLADVGEKPIKVHEGSEIHLRLKAVSDSYE